MGTHFHCKVQDKHTTMAQKVIFTAAALLAVAIAAPAGPPAPYHPAPAAYHEPILPPVYNYEYGVNDPHYGPVFSQKESRDNYDTAGEYRVNLPDGRVQIVSYTANADGYVADVRYEGDAIYPEYKPHPAPAYKPAPAPAYKPAPKPAPAPYKPAPAPYHPAPAYHAAPVYHPAPAPAYTPRTYSFKPVAAPAEPAPAAEEPAEAAPAPAEEARSSAAAAPAPVAVEEAAPVAPVEEAIAAE